MKKINKKGFTLIELLVVIAIIGLLSTMAVISLNSARLKARDAKRLSDVKQMSTLLSLVESDLPSAILRCTGPANCAKGAITTSIVDAQTAGGTAYSGQSLSTEFTKFKDPIAPAGTICSIAVGVTAVTAAQTVACSYSLDKNAAASIVSATNILFMTEGQTGDLEANTLHSISSDGVIKNLAIGL